MSGSPSSSVLDVADAIGKLIEFWGFKRHMGRAWCVLYLHREAMSADELRTVLSVSAGTISMTLNDLLRWHVVKKTWKPGERREYFTAETNIWQMVSRVFRERELMEIRASLDTFQRARRDLASSDRQEEDAAFVDERIKQLEELAKIGERLLSAMLSGDSVDASPLALFKVDTEEPETGKGQDG